jgi:hypothetical protein
MTGPERRFADAALSLRRWVGGWMVAGLAGGGQEVSTTSLGSRPASSKCADDPLSDDKPRGEFALQQRCRLCERPGLLVQRGQSSA